MSVALSDRPIEAMDTRDFTRFRALIHQKTGIWLRDGKEVMLATRLSRRLRHHQMTSFADYFAHISKVRDGGKEMNELINCVTTNKTSFFRESHHFDFLMSKVVPEKQQEAMRGGPKSMHIWCAASSTGEEPYSIVISLLESLRSFVTSWDVKVTASDIDTTVLQTAKNGIYAEDSLDSVDPALQGKYFLRGKGGMAGQFKVKEEVSRHVQYKRINLMDSAWPVDGPLDAIFFRNALIYFNQDTQEIFLRKMVRLLRPGGYLFLGHSENVPWLHDVVQPLHKTIYKLRPTDKPGKKE